MPARISVLAGVNGAGKSSVLGRLARAQGGRYFNPDEYARELREKVPGLSVPDSNAQAWAKGYQGLLDAIEPGQDYAFESTLGSAKSIPSALRAAAAKGMEVRIYYVGLDTVERHIARVAKRKLEGGHDIPEADIRRRYTTSRQNLIDLIPVAKEIRVFDNSAEGTLGQMLAAPEPEIVLHVLDHKVIMPAAVEALTKTPEWAKAIVAKAMGL